MTVAELIAKLREMPQDAEVRTDLEGEVWFGGDGYAEPTAVTYDGREVVIEIESE